MAMFRTLHLGLLFAMLCAAASSCISPPDYSDTPRIKAKTTSVVRLASEMGQLPIDSVTVTISFEDGDGDLGLSTTDTMAPYNDATVNGVQTNPNYFNYYVQPQTKVGDQWKDFVQNQSIGIGEYNGRFPRLGPESGKEAPLKGDLRRNLSLQYGTIEAGTEVRFRVSIRDRALNLSNEVFTEPIIIKGL